MGYIDTATINGTQYNLYKYDDTLNVIKITNANTTMGDIDSTLAGVNTAGDHVVFDVSALNAGMYLCTIYMGSGYYRIADMVTGFEGTGFFTSTDKLADIIKSGSQSSGKHYTVQWDMDAAQCTRLNDAASITTDTTNFGHFGAVNANYDNPFDSIYPWSDRKLCNIDIALYRALQPGDSLTECVVAWEGDVNFSYSHQYGVWVYTPAFFGRSYVLGNYRYFDVTDENLPNNIAYKPSIVGRWLGCDVTLTIDGVSKHCNLPTLGVPMANVTLANQHTYANNWGATLNDIYTLDATSLLYVVEYANMNVQSAIGNGVSGLYLQGDYHPAADVSASTTLTITGLSSSNLNFIIPGAVVDIGATAGSNSIARTSIVSAATESGTTTIILADAVTCTTDAYISIHGLSNVADADVGSRSGYIGSNGFCNAYYRGETWYANKYQYILGAYRQKDTNHVWIAHEGETDDYDALDTTKHIDTGVVLPESASSYIKTLGLAPGLSMPPFCTSIGGSSSAPVGDYCYTPALNTANTVLLLGGGASYGAYCGWFGYWGYPSGRAGWSLGSHPRLKTPA